jgi:hypothetical protein
MTAYRSQRDTFLKNINEQISAMVLYGNTPLPDVLKLTYSDTQTFFTSESFKAKMKNDEQAAKNLVEISNRISQLPKYINRR